MVDRARALLHHSGIGKGDAVRAGVRQNARAGSIFCILMADKPPFVDLPLLSPIHPPTDPTHFDSTRLNQVAAISRNRVEWAVGCLASMSLGATWVPMYEQQRLKECEYILADSNAKLLLVGDERLYDQTRHFKGSSALPGLRDIWTFDVDVPARMAGVTEAMVMGAKAAAPAVRADDVAVLIYTSGTTGGWLAGWLAGW